MILGCSVLSLGTSLAHAQLVLDNDSVHFLTGNYNASLGTGTGQVRWEGSGGFAALSGDRRVRLNNSTASINWDAPYFVGEGNVLILGSPVASGTVLWDKGLNINVSEARIRVVNGAASNLHAEAVLQQALSGSGTLIIEGDGRIDSTINNASFTGDIIVAGAELRLNKAGKLGAVQNIQISSGGTLTLDNAGTHTAASGGQYTAQRINSSSAEVELAGGTLRYIGQSNASTTESLPEIKLESGANTIDLQNPNTSSYTKISAKLTPNLGEGATVNFFSGTGSTYRSTGQADSVLMQLVSSAFPTFGTGTILPWATVNGQNWATIQNGHIVPYTQYDVGHGVGYHPNHQRLEFALSDARPSVSFSEKFAFIYDYNQSLNSIIIDNYHTFGFPAHFSINSGGMMLSGNRSLDIVNSLGYNNIPIAGSITTAGQNPLWIVNNITTTAAAYYHIPIHIPGRGIIHSGKGTTVFASNGNNTINGESFINEGRLILLTSDKLGGIVTVRTSPSGATLEDAAYGGGLHSESTVNLDGVHANDKNAPTYRFRSSSLPDQRLFNLLQIEGRGVLEFAGTHEQKLHLNHLLVLPHDNTGLDVKGWENWVTYFLVKKTSPLLMTSLPYINFEGYAPGAGTRDYSDATYWEIIPLGMVPEPSTYGAILGAAGLAVWAWRRKRRQVWEGARAITLERAGE